MRDVVIEHAAVLRDDDHPALLPLVALRLALAAAAEERTDRRRERARVERLGDAALEVSGVVGGERRIGVDRTAPAGLVAEARDEVWRAVADHDELGARAVDGVD